MVELALVGLGALGRRDGDPGGLLHPLFRTGGADRRRACRAGMAQHGMAAVAPVLDPVYHLAVPLSQFTSRVDEGPRACWTGCGFNGR